MILVNLYQWPIREGPLLQHIAQLKNILGVEDLKV